MKRNGFTLIELMIVIAIIGIIASVALPAYQRWSGGHSEPATIRNGVSAGGLSCNSGFLFSTDANGNTRPATDAEGKVVKC